MGNQTNMIPSALPPYETKPYPNGGNSPMSAGLASSQQQTINQMTLIGKSGGSKHRTNRRHTNRRYMKGGVSSSSQPVSQVTPIPPGAVNPNETTASYRQLAGLANSASTNATYDTAKTPAETAYLQQQQQNIYNGKGGSKKYRRSRNRRSRKSKKGRNRRKTKRRYH